MATEVGRWVARSPHCRPGPHRPTLVLTDTRLHLVRDGVNYRPRTGIQSSVLDRSLTIRMTPVRQRTGRLIVARLGHNASVFLTAAHASDVEALLAELRRRIYTEG